MIRDERDRETETHLISGIHRLSQVEEASDLSKVTL
jgi:hypothetical protein